jgi:hypothetical protein
MNRGGEGVLVSFATTWEDLIIKNSDLDSSGQMKMV